MKTINQIKEEIAYQEKLVVDLDTELTDDSRDRDGDDCRKSSRQRAFIRSNTLKWVLHD